MPPVKINHPAIVPVSVAKNSARKMRRPSVTGPEIHSIHFVRQVHSVHRYRADMTADAITQMP